MPEMRDLLGRGLKWDLQGNTMGEVAGRLMYGLGAGSWASVLRILCVCVSELQGAESEAASRTPGGPQTRWRDSAGLPGGMGQARSARTLVSRWRRRFGTRVPAAPLPGPGLHLALLQNDHQPR